MIAHTHHETYQGGDTYDLVFMGDVHAGAKDSDEKAFARDVARHAENPFARFIFMGDLIDAIVFTDKRYRPSSRRGADRDNIIDYEVDRFCDLAAPAKGKIIGVLTGNHEDVITVKCGTNPAQRIAENLEAPYLGYSALVKFIMAQDNGIRPHATRSVILHVHHGHGGASRTAGGAITTLDRNRSCYEADIFAYGHVHQRKSNPSVVIAWGGKKLIARPKLLLLTGTYLRTLSDSTTPTYAEKKGYPPTAIGGIVCHLKPSTSAPKIDDPGSGWVRITAED